MRPLTLVVGDILQVCDPLRLLPFGPAFDKNLTVTKYCISDKMGGHDSRFSA